MVESIPYGHGGIGERKSGGRTEELKTSEKKTDVTKTVKDVIDTFSLQIAEVITVSLTVAMATAVDRITVAVKSQVADK